MKENIVTFQVAKLAKEKGFDWGCNYFYTSNKKPYVTRGYEYQSDAYVENYNWNNGIGSYPTKASDVLCSAPTQSLLQKWLREVHEIIIYVIPSYIEDESLVYKCNGFDNYIQVQRQTFEEALEEGLYEALKLIK